MSGEPIRLQVPVKLFGVNSLIPQMIRQLIPDCWSGDRKCTELTVLLMTSGRSQMATRNFGDWHAVVDEVPLELGAEENDGLSQQACTVLAQVPASAGRRASAEIDHAHISGLL